MMMNTTGTAVLAPAFAGVVSPVRGISRRQA